MPKVAKRARTFLCTAVVSLTVFLGLLNNNDSLTRLNSNPVADDSPKEQPPSTLGLGKFTTGSASTPSQPSRIEEEQQTVDRRKLYAILHVGPHKTGSTAIQSLLKTTRTNKRSTHDARYRSLLEQDDDMVVMPSLYWETQCMFSIPNNKDCKMAESDKERHFQEMNQAVARAEQQGKNILLSNEALSHTVWNQIQPDKLQSYFSSFELRVIVVYRRFYDWMRSHHNYFYRVVRKWNEWPESTTTKVRSKPIVDYWTRKMVNRSMTYESSQASFQFYSPHFATNLVNYHSGSNVVASFYCLNETRTPHLCQTMRRDAQNETTTTTRANVAEGTAYDEIVMAAHSKGWIVNTTVVTRQNARMALKEYMATSLQIANPPESSSLPMRCLSKNLRDHLLQLSLNMEQTLLPEFFSSPQGEVALRTDFARNFRANFCSVDTKALFQRYPQVGQFLRNITTRTKFGAAAE